MGKDEEAKQEEPTQVVQNQQTVSANSPFSTEAPVQQEKAPAAGPGSFTSVKYSGQPPGGKSNFSLG